MTYRPYRQPHPTPRDAQFQRDPIGTAAGRIVLSPVLPPAAIVQVPWSVKALRTFATICFAVSIIAAFACGGVLVAKAFEGPVVVIALLAYATAFGWACGKLRL